jgi:exopolysaccharide biosynthesis protein
VQETYSKGGVTVRKIAVAEGTSHVRVIEADLRKPGVRVEIAADEIGRREGRVSGVARSVADWLEARKGAVAGVNGGFFGVSTGDQFREIVGLLKLQGRVRSSAPIYHSDRTGSDYARCALGLSEQGTPTMAWVTSRRGDPQSLFAHPAPEFSHRGTAWSPSSAIACGPRLIRDGKVEISFRGERLASPGRLPRTFIGFGGSGERTDRFVLCAATGMEFEECAEFLKDFFQEAYGIPCRHGMCLDGGSSTQAAWRENGAIRTDSPLNAEVPTALLVFSN